jgi:Domain of unknown function (DUF4404)
LGWPAWAGAETRLFFLDGSGMLREKLGRHSKVMIENTIAELEAKIQRAEAVKPGNKEELLQLLSTLRSEIEAFSKTHGEDAERIAGFATVSTNEAIRTRKNPELVNLSLQGLSSSVSEFEESHPDLVRIVNRICETLANLGI